MLNRIWILLFLLVGMQISAQEPPPLSTCTDEAINTAHALTGIYTPSETQGFITLESGQFLENGESYLVRGINYYPANYPWRRFLVGK